MSVSIRPAAAADKTVCLDFIGTLNGGPVTPDWAATFDALLGAERGMVLVAETAADGIFWVATVSFNLAIRYGGEYCQLEELYVDASARGKNVGGLLVEAVIDHATERGCAEIGLYVAERHAANRPFYEKYGFENVGIEVRRGPRAALES